MFWICFGIFLMACFGAGATGGLFPPGQWYQELSKPRWTPPNWLFPLAWTSLYICMSFAGARVAVSQDNGIAMALWSLQIALNGLWTPVFFGLRKIRLGFIVLLGLWASVAASMFALWQVDSLAGLLFVPYLLWVTIAGALNYEVMKLNPDAAKAPSVQPE